MDDKITKAELETVRSTHPTSMMHYSMPVPHE